MRGGLTQPPLRRPGLASGAVNFGGPVGEADAFGGQQGDMDPIAHGKIPFRLCTHAYFEFADADDVVNDLAQKDAVSDPALPLRVLQKVFIGLGKIGFLDQGCSWRRPRTSGSPDPWRWPEYPWPAPDKSRRSTS